MGHVLRNINNCKELYAILNEDTGNIIFSAKNGAYKSIDKARERMVILKNSHPTNSYRIITYALIDDVQIDESVLLDFLEG